MISSWSLDRVKVAGDLIPSQGSAEARSGRFLAERSGRHWPAELGSRSFVAERSGRQVPMEF